MGTALILPPVDPSNKNSILLADFAIKLCDFILTSVETLIVIMRQEYEPFIRANVRQPIQDLYTSIVGSEEKLEHFLKAKPASSVRLVSKTVYPDKKSNAFGDELVCSLEVSAFRQSVIIDFYTMHPAERLMSSVVLTTETISLEAEEKAHELLKKHTTDYQYAMYKLTGTLIHDSEVSSTSYLIRRGFPTLVYDVEEHKGEISLRFKLGLCAHAGGYHPGTFAGILCPTDNVVAHLLMLRADEDAFWKLSNIHLPISSRLGL